MNTNRPQLKNIDVVYSDKNSQCPQKLTSINDIVIFLTGPTPDYTLAKTSWRDSFAKALDKLFDNQKIGHRKILLICPEPYQRNTGRPR